MTCLLTGVTYVLAAAPFPDVAEDSPQSGAISYLKNNAIVTGYADGTFKPENGINRAEALKLVFLVRKALNLPPAAQRLTISFPDVKESDWFYQYVEEAYSLGIVQGYNDGYFRPANQITSAESLKMIYSGLIPDLQLPAVTEPPFVGVNAGEWYAPYLLYGKSRLLVDALDDGSFRADGKMSRAEFAEAIYRAMYMLQNGLEVYPLSTNWRYCHQADLGYKIKRPTGWKAFGAGNQLIFWQQDEGNGQISFARLYPNSAVVIVAVDENHSRLSLRSYLEQIEYGASASRQFLTLNDLPYASITLEQNGLQDSYFELPDGRILAVYAQTGDGPLNYQLREQIRYIIGSVRGSSSPAAGEDNCLASSFSDSYGSLPAGSNGALAISDSDRLKAEILQLVLVKGSASQALDQLNDELLFETDSIGIGTGPVDYYFSAMLNLTLKIDRNSQTILASKSGQTSAF